jgi:hypothetical protein
MLNLLVFDRRHSAGALPVVIDHTSRRPRTCVSSHVRSRKSKRPSSVIFDVLHERHDYLHTVTSLQAIKERAVQESTSGYPGPEPAATSLAAATAAIISSRWNGSRRTRASEHRPVPEPALAEYPPAYDQPEPEPHEPEPQPALRPYLASAMQRLSTNHTAPTSPGPYTPTSPGPYAAPTSPAGYTPPAPYAVSYEPILAAREAAAGGAPPYVQTAPPHVQTAPPHVPAAPPYVPAPAPATPSYVPVQRDAASPRTYTPEPPETDFSFTASVMSDIAFPEPFVPEPYEPYDPLQPYGEDPESSLPQRVPAEPDVPEVVLPPNDPLRDSAAGPIADRGDLSRIATYLREAPDDPDQRPEGFDLTAVVEAVRSVAEVRDAQLRWKPGVGHILRIEFVDGADEGQVTRQVAALLRQTMGLAARPSQTRLSPDESTLDRPSADRTPMDRTPMDRTPVDRRRAGVVGSATVPGRQPEVQAGRALPPPAGGGAAVRVVVDHVQVTTLGLDATVEVRLAMSPQHNGNGYRPVERQAVGSGQGPAVDAYLLRLAATAAGDAVDQLLVDPGTGASKGRCFVEHVAVMPFGPCEVAVVVLLLVCGTFAEQLCGSAIVSGDPRQAVVRATLSAVNRRLESLLS